MTVRVKVENGVAYVDAVPAGVTVEVLDYDVQPGAAVNDRDCDGRECSVYRVEGNPQG